MESPGEAGVGRILTSVAVGCGGGVIVTGVTEFPVEAQAVITNSAIKLANRMLCRFFMQNIEIL